MGTGTTTGDQLAEKVRQAFAEALDLPAETNIETLEIGANPQWDSVGHMALVAELENRFGIMLETDDMIGMTVMRRRSRSSGATGSRSDARFAQAAAGVDPAGGPVPESASRSPCDRWPHRSHS